MYLRRHLKKTALITTVVAFSALACLSDPASDRTAAQQLEPPARIVSSPPLPGGRYGVQSVAYDDATGQYRVFVLGTPAGHSSAYQSADLRLAQLDEEALKNGSTSAIEFSADGAPTLFLTPDYKIEVTHNVTDERVDPSTGRAETIIVRQESSSWSPFASAMMGSMIGNMLFAPRYVVPPPYVAGSPMVGVGGAGVTRQAANQTYAQKFGAEPKSARISNSGFAPRRVSGDSLRSSGAGAGASRLKPSSAPVRPRSKPSFGFGRRRR